MSENLSAGETVAPSDARERSILPLPDDVVAQIKSSTAITSLNGVVLELLKNSLDAKASKVDVTVDFARGGCTVEDDGLGIPPLEFREEGGLGKLYYTSKYHSPEPLLGRNGTVLASLAAVSLMTLTSHHYEYRSHNSVTFHHSKAIERQLPASSNNQVHGKHGTRIMVRNLFGNLPVRVKHRSLILEHKAEHDRLWETLKRGVVALLLGWRGTVSLRVRDGDNRIVFNFNTSKPTVDKTKLNKNALKSRSTQLSSMLNILTQANYISVDEWPSWVPASAATTTLSIKGAISLVPAPSKQVQFISLGIRPLTAESGNNELYDEVNRLFALSSFGTVEENGGIDAREKLRRQFDKRYKNDGNTNKQRNARKDVDRYPMFHLRISFNTGDSTKAAEDQLARNETSLQAVVEVLRAMITQWLSVHHFRPRRSRRRHDRPGTASTSTSDVTDVDSFTTLNSDLDSTMLTAAQTGLRSGTVKSSSNQMISRKRKRTTKPSPYGQYEKTQHRAFAEWSRIKSGKADFFSSLPTLPKLQPKNDAETLHAESSRIDKDSGFADFEMEPVPQGALSVPTTLSTEPANALSRNDNGRDDTILWTDPSTKKTHLLNARTGCIVPNTQARPHTVSASPTFSIPQNNISMSLRLAPKSAGSTVRETPWLDNVLQTWDNPIFKPSEKRIPQVSLEVDESRHSSHQGPHHPCSHLDINKAFNEAFASSSSRLSKQGLQHAQVIAQVDRKFILVKMRNSLNANSGQQLPTELLVLIDQHAADERVRVEALFKELCKPYSDNPSPTAYRSKLGHTAQVASLLFDKPVQFSISPLERTYFTTHAARFATWGILYDILTSTPSALCSATPAQGLSLLSVTALPPAISTRCAADPKLLISLLRSTVWSYASDLHLGPASLSQSQPSANEETGWVRRLATCPPALTDLINSRACRSAIMFNDVLSREECENLVKSLSACVFPFMCAHGRPSMVPLVALGDGNSIGSGMVEGNGNGKQKEKESGVEEEDGGFVGKWKAWKG